MRFDKWVNRQEKEFAQCTYCAGPGGARAWRGKAPPRPMLYGLDLLAARPEATVIVHEGEKAAEAGRALLPDFVHVAWSRGANAGRQG